MTLKQQLIKWLYPTLMRLSKKKATVLANEKKIPAPTSFYTLETVLNNGKPLSFASLKGKKVLLVNTASDCGFTPQYKELQQLYEQYPNQLEIIGFPANDFKEQEKGNDAAIADFCQVNYGVSFPLAKKSVVVKTGNQNKVYQWLSNEKLNGWNDQAPRWNFSKYLIDEAGILTHYFDPTISPVDPVLTKAIAHS